jgi:fibronectin type 3 domain-containing protein
MEMKFGKQIVCTFFVMMLLSSSVLFIVTNNNVVAETSGDFNYQLINGGTEVEITGYIGAGGDVVISSAIDTKPVTSIYDYAFSSIDSIITVSIPTSVTNIGSGAFYSCTSMTSINVDAGNLNYASDAGVLYNYDKTTLIQCPGGKVGTVTILDTVTSIGTEAFAYCAYLTSITMPTDVTTIEAYAFAYCTALTSITIPINVITIGSYAFDHCTALTSLTFTLPSSVTTIGGRSFASCTSLTSVTIPISVTTIEAYAFYSCSSLATVTFTSPSIVATIGISAFDSCTAMTTITIPASVTNIGNYAFHSCSSLTAINVAAANPNFASVDGVLYDNAKTTLIRCPGGMTGTVVIPDTVTTIGTYSFSSCTKLTSITIPTSVITIKTYAFASCTALASVTFTATSKVTTIEASAFQSCSALTSIELPATVTILGDGAFQSCSALTSVVILGNVVIIRSYTFSYCTALTAITIPSSVTFIGANAFSHCTALTSVTFTLPSMVATIDDYAFISCTSLLTITIPSLVTTIGTGAFQSCDAMTAIDVDGTNAFYASVDGVLYNEAITTLIQSPGGKAGTVDIPGTVTNIGTNAFSYCTLLTAITIPASVATIGTNAFYSCTALTAVTIPGSVTSIGDYAFAYCSSLATATFTTPSIVATIGEGAFASCTALTSVTIPGSVTVIGTYAFHACTALTSITVDPVNPNYASVDGVLYNKANTTLIQCPGGKTGAFIIPGTVTSISEWAFYSCNKLTTITIPISVTSIGRFAFSYCTSMVEMRFMGNAPSCHPDWIQNHIPDLTIYYYDGATGFTTPTWYGVNTICLSCPSAPQNFQATAGNALVVLTWEAPLITGNSAITGYKVYRSLTMGGSYGLIESPTVLTFTDTGRTNGQTYWYKVSAVNAIGESLPSAVRSATPNTIPGSPTLASAATGYLNVTLSWTAPASDGSSSITGYEVYYGTSAYNSTWTKFSTVGPSVLREKVTGLIAGTTYYFGVKAVNTVGSSPMSNNMTAVPYTVSNAPILTTATTGVNSAVLIWTAPVDNGSSPITGYLVFYGPTDATTQFGDMLPEETLTVNVTGLSAGTQYFFAIKVVNAAGSSPMSNVLNATVMTVPASPTGLTDTTTSGQVSLIWTAPVNIGGSPIIGYLVYRGTSADSVILIGNSTVATFVDATVAAGSVYYYKVSAKSAAGEGAKSAALSVNVPWPVLVPVSGKVVDASGNGLSGTTVTLENGTSVMTDAQGNFVITTSQGNHTLTISGPGIETKNVVFDVNGPGLVLGNVPTTKTGSGDSGMLVILAIVVIAALLVAGLLYMRKNKGKK